MHSSRYFLLFLLCFFFSSIHAQDVGQKRRHSVSYFNGLTFVPNSAAINAEDDTVNIELNERQHVPCFGFVYQYNFNHKWSMGGFVEFELSRYYISDDGVPLARENIFVVGIPFYFEPFQHFEVFVAPAYEFERHKNLAVVRFGLEYDLYIANDWWIAPEVVFDLKEKYFNYAFAIKLKKTFGKVIHAEH